MPVARQYVQDNYKDSIGATPDLARFSAAMMFTPFVSVFSHPPDTIKTCLQGDVAQEKYKSMPETYSTLMKEGGVGRFFTGWGWRTGRMICAIFIMGQCKDRFAPIFYPHHFRKGGDRA